MRKWNIALGFYQNLQTADSVIKELNQNGFKRVAYIHHARDGQLSVKYIHHHFYTFLISSIIAVIALSGLVGYFGNLNLSEVSIASVLFILLGLFANFIFWKSTTINKEIVDRNKKLVVKDEVLVLVEVKDSCVRDVVHILRHVKTGHPASFLLRSEIAEADQAIVLPKEPLTSEQLREKAIALASSLHVTMKGGVKKTAIIAEIKV